MLIYLNRSIQSPRNVIATWTHLVGYTQGNAMREKKKGNTTQTKTLSLSSPFICTSSSFNPNRFVVSLSKSELTIRRRRRTRLKGFVKIEDN
ncbi:hypothetical protein RJT34_11061 [Clitoria ternatea]|uniref:Uncharacterized protein n=1 Tax=Clitoria ternatea TaxID=43366 RepID=A0AAN9JL78_CLITE